MAPLTRAAAQKEKAMSETKNLSVAITFCIDDADPEHGAWPADSGLLVSCSAAAAMLLSGGFQHSDTVDLGVYSTGPIYYSFVNGKGHTINVCWVNGGEPEGFLDMLCLREEPVDGWPDLDFIAADLGRQRCVAQLWHLNGPEGHLSPKECRDLEEQIISGDFDTTAAWGL